ncbi:hypothetical protein CF392_10625 [Tamilnaduibacter salinus]|uniref:Uncharacterized protein n=1 Tax=Tamilnaduibacter salinus TaxID=1484056 RepID=A0A2A2I309_9GAMM|nr:hypothetical protein [Tamilnaduibacter salinus]PAV25480.1 hypothetical protein CF392_10625 [Tamilnaduibacter salinus]
MSEGGAMTLLRKLGQIIWHLICVVILTAFLGLVSVHNDYYAGGSGDSDPLAMPLSIGIALAPLVLFVHALRWRKQHHRKDQSRL